MTGCSISSLHLPIPFMLMSLQIWNHVRHRWDSPQNKFMFSVNGVVVTWHRFEIKLSYTLEKWHCIACPLRFCVPSISLNIREKETMKAKVDKGIIWNILGPWGSRISRLFTPPAIEDIYVCSLTFPFRRMAGECKFFLYKMETSDICNVCPRPTSSFFFFFEVSLSGQSG